MTVSPHSSNLERCIILLSGACLISFALLLAGCGGTEKRSCTLTGFSPAPGSPLKAGEAGATIAGADFNGDGRQDLALVDRGNIVTIQLGERNGDFGTTPGSTIEFPTRSSRGGPALLYSHFMTAFAPAPIDLVIGDWNGDGHPDLADLGGWPSDDISVLLGNGKGEFEKSKPVRAKEVSAGMYQIRLPLPPVAGDFNSDGHADIASADVLLGDGKGGFKEAPGSPLAVGDSPSALAIGDFNGDRHQDLVIADQSNSVVLQLGDGKGGFKAAAGSPFAADGSPSGVAVADFNGDGNADVAVSGSDSTDLTVLLGNGRGGLEPAAESPFTVGGGPVSVASGDFNGDGLADIATANYLSNDVTVLLGNGKGGFKEAAGSPYLIDNASRPTGIGSSPQNLHNLVAADFNRDGRDDLAVAEFQQPGVSVLFGRCD